MHLLQARAEDLDWERLLGRFGEDWRVLLSHLVLFGFVYPTERERVPRWVMRRLLDRLRDELDVPGAGDRVCRGTLVSREQYLYDLEVLGYRDARLLPDGTMTAEEIDLWTARIEEDGSQAADTQLSAAAPPGR